MPLGLTTLWPGLAAYSRWTNCLGENFTPCALYRLVPVASGQEARRIYRAEPFLREDGQFGRRWIYFTRPNDDVVNLRRVEAIEG